MLMKYISFCGSTQDGISCGKVLRRGISMCGMIRNGSWFDKSLVGTSRCDVPARVQRAERAVRGVRLAPHVAPLLRGADGAARRPYQWMQRVRGMARHQAGVPDDSQHKSLSTFLLCKEVDGRARWQVSFVKNSLDDFETVSSVEQ